MDAAASYNLDIIKAVFKELKGRRAGMVKALTIDVEKFYQKCNPENETLCLYGFPNNHWEVNMPAEKVPTEIPEPTLGINFVRDQMQKKDWLSMVAKHSDSWLLALFSFFCSKFGFDKAEREKLFNMINDLPTISEVVKEMAKKKGKDGDENGLEENNEEEDENTLCGLCGKNYVVDGFWIRCDICCKWFHGKCVKITPARAEHIKKYKCPSCNKKRARP